MSYYYKADHIYSYDNFSPIIENHIPIRVPDCCRIVSLTPDGGESRIMIINYLIVNVYLLMYELKLSEFEAALELSKINCVQVTVEEIKGNETAEKSRRNKRRRMNPATGVCNNVKR